MPIAVPDPNDEYTIFRQAADTGDLKTVTELIQKGINVNATNQHEDTALHLAAFYGHTDIVSALVRAKANLNHSNKNGQTPLQLAASRGHLDVVKELAKAGCDLNINTNFSEFTALHFASKNGQYKVCQYLLDSGADEFIEDLIGQNAESYAPNPSTEEVFKKYQQKTGRVKKPLDKKQEASPKDPVPKPANKPADIKPEASLKNPVATEVAKSDPKVNQTTQNKGISQPSVTNQKQAAGTVKANQNDKKEETVKPTAAEKNNVKSQTKDSGKQNPSAKDAGKSGPPEGATISGDEARDKWKFLAKSETSKLANHDKFQGDDSTKKFMFKKKETEFSKLKDRKFEFSEEHKARMKLSVYDRLMGKK